MRKKFEMEFRLPTALAVIFVAMASASIAQADPILGGVTMAGGGAVPTGVDSDGSGNITLDEATGIDFSSPGIVTFGVGDFATVAFGTPVVFNDFTFNPSTSVDPLWTFTSGGVTFSFAADSFNVDVQTRNTLGITGKGTMSATGFDDTAGAWSFSMDSINGAIFGWSSTTVPEPGTLALLCLGLAGLGISSRRRKA